MKLTICNPYCLESFSQNKTKDVGCVLCRESWAELQTAGQLKRKTTWRKNYLSLPDDCNQTKITSVNSEMVQVNLNAEMLSYTSKMSKNGHTSVIYFAEFCNSVFLSVSNNVKTQRGSEAKFSSGRYNFWERVREGGRKSAEETKCIMKKAKAPWTPLPESRSFHLKLRLFHNEDNMILSYLLCVFCVHFNVLVIVMPESVHEMATETNNVTNIIREQEKL